MSRMQNNLGRGLSDLIGEVSQVKAVPNRAAAEPAPQPPPPREAPAPVQRPPERGLLVPALAAALLIALAGCGVLAWKLGHQPVPEPVVKIVVPEVKPLEPPPPAPVVAPAPPPRDTRLDWAQGAGRPGIAVEPGADAVRWVFDEPLFKTRDQLRPEAVALLKDAAAAFLPHAADCVLVVAGHTDNDPPRVGGPYRDNIALGYLRALAVADQLRLAGVPPESLRVTSRGDADAPYPNTDAAGRQRNRTATLRFEKKAGR